MSRQQVKYRHDPNEPLETVCELMARTAASGKRYWFGFSTEHKFLVFVKEDGSAKLCRQPLSRTARDAIPTVAGPSLQELNKPVPFRPEDPTRMPFVSGLPAKIGKY